MKAEVAEYEIGKRHLANIMGVDAESFTQKDIDVSLEIYPYLNLNSLRLIDAYMRQ